MQNDQVEISQKTVQKAEVTKKSRTSRPAKHHRPQITLRSSQELQPYESLEAHASIRRREGCEALSLHNIAEKEITQKSKHKKLHLK